MIETSHQLYKMRDDKRKENMKKLQDQIRSDYESGNYEISDLGKHFSTKYMIE